MTSLQYCFDIDNPDSEEVDIDALKNFVQNLYIGKKEPKFENKLDAPFVTIHVETDNSICVLMTSVGKSNIKRVEDINKTIKKKNLTFGNVTLSSPYVFDVDAQTWWGSSPKKGQKWESIKQRGPYFKHLMDPYKFLKSSLTYEGKKYPLSAKEEQVAGFYASRLISESKGGVTEIRTEDPVFNKNFFKDFKTYLTPAHKSVFKDISKIGWKDLIYKIESLPKAKDLSKAEKKEKKTKDEERKRDYGYAFIDGKREKVGNYTVEPVSIFMGVGKNPKRGKIKHQVNPEDVTLNIGKKDKKPKAPPGHKWGAIVNDTNAVWIAKWKDKITGNMKYVYFTADGRFKGAGDFEKYQKARKLNKHLKVVETKYLKDASSSNKTKKQLGTVLYFIDNFGIRVGNEIKKNETETYGISTILVKHINLKKQNHVTFDFLGKDSVRYIRIIKIPDMIYKNLVSFTKQKSPKTPLFDLIDSNKVNQYLKQFDKKFTAKVFRTRLASVIMYKALKKLKIPKGSNKSKIKLLFNKANVEVAVALNHSRNISTKAKESMEKDKAKLVELKKKMASLKKEGKSITAVSKQIETKKNNIESKSNLMNVAITTSIDNYIDPRLVIAWSEKQKIDLGSIYSKALLEKFKWALTMSNKSWDYIDSPLVGTPDLEPDDGTDDDIKTKKSPKKKPSKNSNKITPLKKITPVKKITHMFPIIGPGPLEDYKSVLFMCKNPRKKPKLSELNVNVIKWIYPFSKHAVENGSDNKTNKIIINYHEAVYK
jgi:DNA topoisomerase-1